MRRSQSSAATGMISTRQSQPSFGLLRENNGSNLSFVGGGISFEAAGDQSLPLGWNLRRDSSSTLNSKSKPNAHDAAAVGLGRSLLGRPKNNLSKSNARTAAAAASAGRSLLDRPINEVANTTSGDNSSAPDPLLTLDVTFTALAASLGRYLGTDHLTLRRSRSSQSQSRRNVGIDCSIDHNKADATFGASAADSPIPRANTELTLKSCLSSSGSIFGRSKSSVNGFGNSANASQEANKKNEEFNMVRNVSFSHVKVREYEVTLGDNPSVSSGAPLSLGWRYNPQENISRLDSNEAESPSHMRRSRSISELKLSDRERQHRLRFDCPNVTMEDIFDAVQSTEAARLERRESIKELKMEVLKRRQDMYTKDRQLMRRRRMGIVDGGLSISQSLLSLNGGATAEEEDGGLSNSRSMSTF